MRARAARRLGAALLALTLVALLPAGGATAARAHEQMGREENRKPENENCQAHMRLPPPLTAAVDDGRGQRQDDLCPPSLPVALPRVIA